MLAREHGCRSWAEFRRRIEASPLDDLGALERGEAVVDSGLAYADGRRPAPPRFVERLADASRAVHEAVIVLVE